MYDALLEYLRCTACNSRLTLAEERREAGEIVSGTVSCMQCRATWPIRDGILDTLGVLFPTSIAHFVNELAPSAWAYERVWRPFALSLLSGKPFGYAQELPLILELAQAQAGLILDVACSNGLYARALARRAGRAGHVAAIDHSLEMLRDGRRRARAEGLSISFVRARAQRLPFCPASARCVAVGGSLNEIGDLDGCLAEIRRVLAADGRFVAMTLTRHPQRFEQFVQSAMQSGGVRFWSEADLVTHVERAGFNVAYRRHEGIVLFTLALPR